MKIIKKISYKKLSKIIVFSLMPVIIIFLSLYFCGNHIGEYFDYLVKPYIVPRNNIFIIIIATVYALFGHGIYLVTEKKNKEDIKSIILYVTITLLLNFLFIITFFKYQLLDYSLYIMIALGLLSSSIVKHFYKLNKNSLRFMIFYLIFVFYFIYITYFIYSNN